MRSVVNLFRSIKTPALLFILTSFIAFPAFADAQASLIDAQRREAAELIYAGHVDQAGPAVLNSLRALTTNDSVAIDRGFGSVHLEMFILGSLYEKEDWAAASAALFEPSQTEMDRFLYNYFRSMCGLRGGEDVPNRAELVELIHAAEVPAVRAYAAFVVADPYWAYPSKEAEQARLWLAKNYPDTELARTAMWFPLVKNRAEGLTGLLSALDYRALSDTERAYRREDTLYVALKNAFGAGLDRTLAPEEVQTAVAQVIAFAEHNDDLLVRYTALLVLKSLEDDATRAQFYGFCKRVAENQTPTPDVVRARRFLCGDARKRQSLEEMEYYMELLYACQNRPSEICELDFNEAIFNATINHAKALAKMGQTQKSAETYQRIAETYPGTAPARAFETTGVVPIPCN